MNPHKWTSVDWRHAQPHFLSAIWGSQQGVCLQQSLHLLCRKATPSNPMPFKLIKSRETDAKKIKTHPFLKSRRNEIKKKKKKRKDQVLEMKTLDLDPRLKSQKYWPSLHLYPCAVYGHNYLTVKPRATLTKWSVRVWDAPGQLRLSNQARWTL